jgi:RimJ/RimL family protein N-acetyltransferase
VGLTIIEVDQLPAELTNNNTSHRNEYSNWGEQNQPPEPPQGLRRWVINHNNQPVGSLGAHPVGYGPNAGSTAMNIGVEIEPDHRRQGFGSESQRLLAELLHDEGYVRVEASTDVTNVPEQRALAKAGFEFEGTLRQAQLRASGRHDLQVWSRLS